MRLIRFGKIVLCALVMLGAPFANAVAEDEPDGTWNAPPVGTKATYNFGASWEVVAVDGGKVHVRGARSSQLKSATWHIYKGIAESISSEGKKRSYDTATVDKLFPLKVSNKTTVNYSERDWNLNATYEVVAFKRVKTILGTRQLFKIAFTEKGVGHRAKGWGFYDPELGVWIGGDYTWGNNPTYKWRLVRLDLPE